MKSIIHLFIIMLGSYSLYSQSDTNLVLKNDTNSQLLIKSLDDKIKSKDSERCIVTFVGCDRMVMSDFNKFFYEAYLRNSDRKAAFEYANNKIRAQYPDTEVKPQFICK